MTSAPLQDGDPAAGSPPPRDGAGGRGTPFGGTPPARPGGGDARSRPADRPKEEAEGGPTGLTAAEAASRLAHDGPNEVAEAPGHPLRRFARKFGGVSAGMLEAIVVLSVLLGRWTDAWVALALLLVNAVLGFLQEQRASAAVALLRQRLSVTARVLRDGHWRAVPARVLVVGDVVRVRAGDVVPADLRVLGGTVRVDQSVLTGETQEVPRGAGEDVHSGSLVRDGEATAAVGATGERTYFGHTTRLVESAHPKLHVEEVVGRVARWLLLLVGVLVAATVAVSWARGLAMGEVLPLALVLLMSAVPVALPVMFTVSAALGSLHLVKRGVLVTALRAVEDAADMDLLCADKTGTLTENRPSLVALVPRPGFTEQDVLQAGAWASNEANEDPLDLAFLEAARARGVGTGDGRVVEFLPFSARTRRTEAVVETARGRVRAVKGALAVVAQAAGLGADEAARAEREAAAEADRGARVIAVARAVGEGPLRLAGLAFLRDRPRADSPRLIADLRDLGVEVKMLTGDALPVARGIGKELGLPAIVRARDLADGGGGGTGGGPVSLGAVDGAAELFPEDKIRIVRALQAEGRVVGMTGDGVNDAPALRQAEVGIAVHGATDVAKGAASAVLTTEGLAGIVEMVRTGREIHQRILTWIVNKVSRTLLKAGLVVGVFLATGRFVTSALGMVLLVFLTDFVKIALATDRVRPSSRPETWHVGPLVRIAVLLGALMLLEALGLLAVAWGRLDLGDHEGRMRTFAFQTLLFFALFSLVSVRERRSFWASRPSGTLALALLADGGLGVVIGVAGFGDLAPLPLPVTALVAAWAALCCLGPNDALKAALTARALRRAGAVAHGGPSGPPSPARREGGGEVAPAAPEGRGTAA